jgi:hypothetical protein
MEINFKGSLTEFRSLFQGIGPAFQPSGIEELEAADEIRIEHSAPLSVVPDDYARGVAEVSSSLESVKLPTLTEEERAGALAYVQDFSVAWTQGFGVVGAEQPDRLQLMKDIGTCRWVRPILILAYEKRSLQRLIMDALQAHNLDIATSFKDEAGWFDFIECVCSNMVAVSHKGLPDLAGTYDYSTKWKRS